MTILRHARYGLGLTVRNTGGVSREEGSVDKQTYTGLRAGDL